MIAIYILLFVVSCTLSIRYFGRLLDLIVERTKKRGLHNGSWKTHLGVGNPKTSRIEKAAIARIGLGANSSKETIYWNCFSDSFGEPLHSTKSYVVAFEKDLSVDYNDFGFWSLTVYGDDKFLVPNDYKKYGVNSMTQPFKNEDGSFEICLSRYPDKGLENWIALPQNDEPFSLALRCYKPLTSMQENATDDNLPIIRQAL